MTEADDSPTSKRLRILEPGRSTHCTRGPASPPDEQSLYFTLTAPERHSALSLSVALLAAGVHPPARLLQSRCLFFPIVVTEVADDVAAVWARHFPQALLGNWPPPSKPTILKQRTAILDLFQYRLCLVDERRLYARALARRRN